MVIHKISEIYISVFNVYDDLDNTFVDDLFAALNPLQTNPHIEVTKSKGRASDNKDLSSDSMGFKIHVFIVFCYREIEPFVK